jgi:hypothetical protein
MDLRFHPPLLFRVDCVVFGVGSAVCVTLRLRLRLSWSRVKRLLLSDTSGV